VVFAPLVCGLLSCCSRFADWFVSLSVCSASGWIASIRGGFVRVTSRKPPPLVDSFVPDFCIFCLCVYRIIRTF